MTAVVSVFVVVALGLLITRVATVMLTHTGLSHEVARFQARSSFLGVGFTTSEAESVVNHPVRRRIVMSLMWLGNAGIVTVLGTLILTFTAGGGSQPVIRALLLCGGLGLLVVLARSRFVDRPVSRVIDWVLRRWTSLEVRDYASLLHLQEDYAVTELAIAPDNTMAGRTLGELALRDEGVVVLGVQRADGDYVGAPDGDTEIRPGDLLLIYGREAQVCELGVGPGANTRRTPAGTAAGGRSG